MSTKGPRQGALSDELAPQHPDVAAAMEAYQDKKLARVAVQAEETAARKALHALMKEHKLKRYVGAELEAVIVTEEEKVKVKRRGQRGEGGKRKKKGKGDDE